MSASSEVLELPRLQFEQKAEASVDPVVGSSINTVLACVFDLEYMRACPPHTYPFVRQIISDIVVHGMHIAALDVAELEMWVRDRDRILTDDLDKAMAKLKARVGDVDFTPVDKPLKYMEDEWQPTLAVINASKGASDALGALPGTAGLVEVINAMLKKLRTARSAQLMHNALYGGEDRHKPTARQKAASRKKQREGRLGKPKPGELLELDLDKWKYLFTGKPGHVSAGSVQHLVTIVSRFFNRRDPVTTPVVVRPKRLSDVGHPVRKHTTFNGYVYEVKSTAALPIVLGSVNHKLDVSSPCLTAWPVIRSMYVTSSTDMRVSAQHGGRLIFARPDSFAGGNDTLRGLNTRVAEMADNLATRQRTAVDDSLRDDEDLAGDGGGVTDGEVNAMLYGDEQMQHLVQGTIRQTFDLMKANHRLQEKISQHPGQRIAPDMNEDAPVYKDAMDAYRKYANHFAVQMLAGKKITDVLTPSSYDPNYVPKMENNRDVARHAFSMTRAMLEPSSTSKNAKLATQNFELSVNNVMWQFLGVLNVMASLLGLPGVDIKSADVFRFQDQEEKTVLETAQTRHEVAKRQRLLVQQQEQQGAAQAEPSVSVTKTRDSVLGRMNVGTTGNSSSAGTGGSGSAKRKPHAREERQTRAKKS